MGSGEGRKKENGVDGRVRKQYPPPRKGVPDWLRAVRPRAKPAKEGVAGGQPGAKGKEQASFDSLDFKDSDAKLKRWTLGGRALWEELALSERDMSQIRCVFFFFVFFFIPSNSRIPSTLYCATHTLLFTQSTTPQRVH